MVGNTTYRGLVDRGKTAASLLRSLREAQGRTLRTVAGDLGVAPSQLSRVERGERNYTTDLGRRLADYYGVPAETLELLEGRIPEDIVAILQAHPEVIEDLRSRYSTERAGDRVDERPE